MGFDCHSLYGSTGWLGAAKIQFCLLIFNAMAVLPILCYPDPRLNTPARAVQGVDARIRQLVADMIETMYDARGIGLAATQVNVHERVAVIDVSENHDQPLVLINPEIVWASPEKQVGDEGCLSVPGIYDGVERSESVRLRALNEEGYPHEIEASGLLAICIQHEMDHLRGKVFVEYLSPLKRSRIKSKMLKRQREEREEREEQEELQGFQGRGV